MEIGMPLLYEFDTVEDNLKLAKELELDFVELNLNFSYLREEMEEKSLASLFKKYKLKATLHFYDEADFGTYDEVAEAYLKLLHRYAKLGKGYVKVINIHLISGPVVTISGEKNYIYKKEFDKYIKRLVKNLKRAEVICAEYGITMVLENTDYMAKFMRYTYKVLNQEGFKFNYDIGHDNVDGDFIYNVIMPELNLKFDEFHIHDSNGRVCHLALGEGNMDIYKYKRLAKGAYVVLEVKKSGDLYTSVPIFKEL